MTDKYALRYTFLLDARSEGYTKEDIENDDQGLCDAFLAVSVLRSENGIYSQAIFGYDGDTKSDLSDNDVFKVWVMMGAMLYDNNLLKGWKKKLVSIVATFIKSRFK